MNQIAQQLKEKNIAVIPYIYVARGRLDPRQSL